MKERKTIGVREAKANFSKLVRPIEGGSCSEVVITRAGKPAARLVSVRAPIRLGVADGRFRIPDDIDALNPAIEKLFMGSAKVARRVRPRR